LAALSVALGQNSVNSGNAQFQKQGGSINVISTNGVWMSLQWASLTEYGPQGNVVQSVDLTKHSFGWSQPEVLPVIVDLVDTKEHFPAVNFTHRLDNGAWFNVTAWLLNADSNWTSAKHNDVKWNFNIGQWPWVGGTSASGEGSGWGTLVLNAGMVGFGGVVRSATNKQLHAANSTVSTAAFSQGFLSSPSQALYDGAPGPVGVSHTLSGKPVVFWTFGFFADTLIYDPVFSPKAGNSGGGSNLGNGNSKTPSNPTSQVNTAQFQPDGSFGISTNGNWMALQWATLAEVDSTGIVLQSVDLSTHHFGWSQPQVLAVVDTNRVETGQHFPAVNFSEQLINGAWFNVTAWILPNNATSAKQKHGLVKWSVYISGWPWLSSVGGEGIRGNLVLTAGMVGFGGIVRSTDNQAYKGSNATVTTQEYGSGFLSSPTQATYDGYLGPVAVAHTLSGKPVVSWTFDRFTNYVSFDPEFFPGDSNNGRSAENVWRADGPAMISIYTILGVLLVVGLIIGIYFVTRVKRNRRFSNEAAKIQEQVDLSPPGTEISSTE
jgi:hypothetical protein